MLREEKSYVSSLSAAIGSDQLQLFTTVTKKEYEKDFLKRDMLVEQITDDVLNEARLGYGSLIIAKFDGLEEASDWADSEPYVSAGDY